MVLRQEDENVPKAPFGGNSVRTMIHYDAGVIPEFDKRPAFIHVLLLNKTIRLFVVLAVASVIVPVFAYLFFFSKEIGHGSQRDIIGTCGHPSLYHVPCGSTNLSLSECHLLGCCYTTLATCYHSLPSEHQLIIGSDWVVGSPAILTPLRSATPYREPALQEVRFDVFVPDDGSGRLRFLLSKTNATVARDTSVKVLETADLQVQIYNPTFFLEVKRKVDQEVIFSTARGPLIVTENFIEWSLHLGADILFGLGRAYLEPGNKYLLLNSQNSSAIPIVMGYNAKLKLFNGIIFNTPGLTEVEILGSRLIIVRAQLAESFDLQFLAGPTPAPLLRQSKAILRNQYTPPYWSYGVHVCDQSPKRNLTVVRHDLEQLLNQTIMFDSHCLHNDQFWISDNMALDKDVESLRQMLRNAEKKFVPSLVLAVRYGGNPTFIDAREHGILLRARSTLLPYQGRLRNQTVVYIDWRTSQAANLSAWFETQWPKIANLAADGYTLEEVNPRDDRNNTLPGPGQLVYQPEQLNASLLELVPWSTVLSDSVQLVLSQHNRLGVGALDIVQRLAASNALLITEAHDVYSKAALLPSNVSTSWIALRSEVDRIIGLSVVGISFTGTPVCGNNPLERPNVAEELCIRWYQFGSLLPLFRVSADRTPNRFSRYAQRLMHAALRRRFALLEMFHTLILEDTAYLRPMFYHYEESANFTLELWEQFMIGEALLVAPVLLPQMTQIAIYFPDTFYELWSGQEMPANDVLQYSVVDSDLPMFLRPGFILPVRDVVEEHTSLDGGRVSVPVSVERSRLKPIILIGAFTCNVRRWKCSTVGHVLFLPGFQLDFGVDLDEQIVVSVRAHVTAPETARQEACSSSATLNATITSLRLYGHPNYSQPLEYDVEYNFCLESTKRVELPNAHRKGPADFYGNFS